MRTLFDRAAQHGTGAIDFFGDQITLPPEARFGSMESVQRYVDDVLGMPAVVGRWPDAGAIRVRARRSATAAHYENTGGVAVIAVPDRTRADWAMRELVVLHEVAHHLHQGPGSAHGTGFIAAFCELTAIVMGPEAGHVLRVVYAKEGAR